MSVFWFFMQSDTTFLAVRASIALCSMHTMIRIRMKGQRERGAGGSLCCLGGLLAFPPWHWLWFSISVCIFICMF